MPQNRIAGTAYESKLAFLRAFTIRQAEQLTIRKCGSGTWCIPDSRDPRPGHSEVSRWLLATGVTLNRSLLNTRPEKPSTASSLDPPTNPTFLWPCLCELALGQLHKPRHSKHEINQSCGKASPCLLHLVDIWPFPFQLEVTLHSVAFWAWHNCSSSGVSA